MEEELVRAILIASDPSQGPVHHQALEYLSSVQQHTTDTWRLALALFLDVLPDGTRKYPPQARFYALRMLDDFFDNRYVLSVRNTDDRTRPHKSLLNLDRWIVLSRSVMMRFRRYDKLSCLIYRWNSCTDPLKSELPVRASDHSLLLELL
jgi:hypothetical protein